MQSEDQLAAVEREVRDRDAYFLVPNGFKEAINRHLKALGVPEKQSRYEFFGPASALE